MIYGSICSGIEAAYVAWEPLGWRPAWFSEIAPFPSAVLAHRWPDVPNLGDMTAIHKSEVFQNANIDVLIGGTPCQSFSVAGLRGGLDDDRGQLALQFCKLARASRARWVVWENVPGVLSSNAGRDFGSIVGALVKLGYGVCWRVLDAQFVRVESFRGAVPQRRRRVFVVGYFGDWRPAASVLFEPESMSGNPAPRREAGARIAASLTRGADSGGRGGYAGRRQEDDVNVAPIANALSKNGVGASGADDNQAQAGHLVAVIQDGREIKKEQNGLGISTDGVSYTVDTMGAQAIAFQSKQSSTSLAPSFDDCAPTLDVAKAGGAAVAFAQNQRDEIRTMDAAGALAADPGMKQQTFLQVASAVRRLTPIECERLQGFPDGYTAVPYRGKPAADGPRYQALGNSMAVNVVRWIGERIALFESIKESL